MARVRRKYLKECGCRRCGTSATMIEYECGCVLVDIHNDRARCDECTNFSGMRYRCRPGDPRDH